MNLIPTEAKMTSIEIAELTGKRHSDVMRDTRTLIEQGAINERRFALVNYTDKKGEDRPMFTLDFNATMTLITGYDAVRRSKVIDRWADLERGSSENILTLPDFSNPAEAARAWAVQYERAQLAESTKAEIGSRREATAMNTASQAVKQVKRLEQELDRSMQYITVKRMSMLYHGQKFNWRILKGLSQEMELPPIDVFDQNYGSVKAYHVDVWQEAYAISPDVEA